MAALSEPMIRAVGADDVEAMLVANKAEVPAVGPLDRDRLVDLLAMAETAMAAEVDGDLAGFVIALPPGAGYASPNYRPPRQISDGPLAGHRRQIRSDVPVHRGAFFVRATTDRTSGETCCRRSSPRRWERHDSGRDAGLVLPALFGVDP